MTTILAIDPGNVESAYALIDAADLRPLSIAKVPNAEVLDLLSMADYDELAVEMVASYGMAVGREVFDTCVWIGRFIERAAHIGRPWQQVFRKDVKLNLCQNTSAKDSNITQALIDRFAYNVPNRGKGSKADPGWFYGFAADIWQAYALAVTVGDTCSLTKQLVDA